MPGSSAETTTQLGVGGTLLKEQRRHDARQRDGCEQSESDSDRGHADSIVKHEPIDLPLTCVEGEPDAD